eukprot:692113-Pyramimonas_sp.AAC.1
MDSPLRPGSVCLVAFICATCRAASAALPSQCAICLSPVPPCRAMSPLVDPAGAQRQGAIH